MTGREQRILQNYDSITTKQYENEQLFSLNELTHNLDLVIESCEESMIRSHRRYRKKIYFKKKSIFILIILDKNLMKIQLLLYNMI